MATTVASHPAPTATTPVNGDPLDATVIRGLLNAIRDPYVAHDADTGIHLQSSAIASRPAAGTSGRKWLTIDSGVAKLWYDTGAAWVEVTGLTFTVTNGQPPLHNAGNSGTSLEINWNNGPVQQVTLTGNATLTFTNVSAGATYTLVLVQDGSGGKTVTLTGWEFGDNPPTYNTAAGKKNVVSGLYDGTEYLAALAVVGG